MPCGNCEERRQLALNAVRALREKNMRLFGQNAGRFASSSIGSIAGLVGMRGQQNSAPDIPPDPPPRLRVRPDVVRMYHLDARRNTPRSE